MKNGDVSLEPRSAAAVPPPLSPWEGPPGGACRLGESRRRIGLMNTRILGTAGPGLMIGFLLPLMPASLVGLRAQEPPAASVRMERLEAGDGRKTPGRVGGDAVSGFRFVAEEGTIPLKPGALVIFEGPEPSPLAGLPPFHASLGLDQRISGRLVSVDEAEVRLAVGSGQQPVGVLRGGVQALLQRPGEAQVVTAGFETLDDDSWVPLGDPQVVRMPRLAGEHSLQLPAGGTSLTYHLPEPVGSGRLEVAYYDSGARVADQRWFVDLTFRGAVGAEPIRAVLGWEDASLAVESPQGPALAVQRLARKTGWHRLVVRFGPGGTEMAVDGDELAHGGAPGGPLMEIRLASYAAGKMAPPDDLAGHFDDLSLARLSEPAGELEIDPTQDELRLVGGDQLYGQVRSATPSRVIVRVDGRDASLGWQEVAGVYFRRAPVQSRPVEGLLVRLEWRAASGNDPRDIDRIEGALTAVTDGAFTVATPFAGTLTVPRDQVRRLQVLGPARRIVLDATAHHLGDSIFPNLDPPQHQGHELTVPFELDQVAAGDAFVVMDVVQVLGEAANLTFAAQLKKGELRTNLFVNDRLVDHLNRHITSKNETPERIRLPIPAGLLHPGRNVLRLEQVGTAQGPEYDDLGILCIALEFPTSRPDEAKAEKSGP
jgi:hypothetical protein